MSYRPAFFNPDAYGADMPCATRFLSRGVLEDASGLERAIQVFGLRRSAHIICVREIDTGDGFAPAHVLYKFTDIISPRVEAAIRICEHAKDFLASTDELDAAVATLKEFGMCFVGGNDAVPEKTFISRNEKGADHKWDICTDGAMLLQVHNNDLSRSHCTRVYFSKLGELHYEVHVVLKKTETLRRAGTTVAQALAMEEVRKRFLEAKCAGAHSAAATALAADPAALSKAYAERAAERIAAVIATRQARNAQAAEDVEAEGRARRDEEAMAAGSK